MDYKLDDHVVVIDDVFTAEQCDMTVKYYDDNEDRIGTQGQIWTSEGRTVNEKIKKVKQVTIELGTEVDDMFAESCSNLISEYKRRVVFYPVFGVNDNGYCIKKYNAGEDFYDWHVDSGCPSTLNRLIAMLWYLNDVEEGGETEFKSGAKVHPRKGSVLMFPANFCFPHRANVPISGPKYIVNTFIFGV